MPHVFQSFRVSPKDFLCEMCMYSIAVETDAAEENEMKSIGALSGLRGLMFVLVFLAGYTAAVDRSGSR